MVGGKRAVGDVDEKILAERAIFFCVLIKARAVDEDLLQELFDALVVHLKLHNALGSFVFQVCGLLLHRF